MITASHTSAHDNGMNSTVPTAVRWSSRHASGIHAAFREDVDHASVLPVLLQMVEKKGTIRTLAPRRTRPSQDAVAAIVLRA